MEGAVSKRREPERRTAKGHSPSSHLVCGIWPYCLKCGLLYIRNDVTRRAIKAPCPGDDE